MSTIGGFTAKEFQLCSLYKIPNYSFETEDELRDYKSDYANYRNYNNSCADMETFRKGVELSLRLLG